MAVQRSARDIPLGLTADALVADVVSGYDFPGDTSGSNDGDGDDFVGAAHWTKNGTIPLVSGISLPEGGTCQGRDVSNGGAASGYYSLANGLYGILGAHGTADFSLWLRVKVPTPNTDYDNSAHLFGRLTTENSGTHVQLAWFKVSASSSYNLYAYETKSGTALICNWSHSPNYAPGTVVDIYLTRVSGTWYLYSSDIVGGGVTLRNSTSGLSASIGSSAGLSYLGLAFGDAQKLDTVLIDGLFWDVGLDDTDIEAHHANPYNYYDHAVNPDVITVSTPTDSSTVGANISISGTYGGDNAPTAIEASFNGGSYATIDAAPTGGTFSGVLSGQTPATGTLTVRWANDTAVNDTVTSLTVTANSITLTSPSHGEFFPLNPQTSGTATITVAGTYTGTPTSIQYRWNDGSWTTLDASPTGGTFSEDIVVGMGQVVDVRFSNATTVTDEVIVGAGDVIATSGQSNNVGQASNYVVPVAPDEHPRWIAYEYDKTGNFRELTETAGSDAYSSTVGAQFAVWSGETGLGSWAGACSTLLMEEGLVVCFAPVARGSTTSANWLMDGGDPTDTTTLFGAALTIANQIADIKGLIHWQGEADVADPTTWSTNTESIIDDWFTQTGTKTVLTAICKSSFTDPTYSTFHAAVETLANSNANVAAFADMENAWSSGGVHYDGETEINNVATIMAAAIIEGFYSFTAQLDAIYDQNGDLLVATSLNWQWFDELVAPYGAAITSGTFITDGAGVPPPINLPGTSLVTGEFGTVHATNLLEDLSNLDEAVVLCYPVEVQ
jgi:hypothetical protein